jgi:hypothetical protein
MELRFFILLAISYLGPILGVIISYFSKEEIQEGKKYFRILKSFIFLVILSLFLNHLALPYFISIPVSSMLALFLYFCEKRITQINPEIFYYSFFSVVFYETIKISPIYAVLIFIYGIPAASIQFEDNYFLKNIWKAISGNLIFLLLSICLYVFRT